MSKITTRSRFYFGGEITRDNSAVDFDEGGLELKASMKVGDYSMSELATEMARAMTEAGTQNYTGTFNRSTRKITITATSSFKLRTNTGSRIGSSAWTVLGWTTAADTATATSQTSDATAGLEYETQYPVDKYTAEDDYIVKETGTVNVSATGVTQQISFADGSRISFNIRLITNTIGLLNPPFFDNASGVADFKTFIRAIMKKGKFEFMPDEASVNTFEVLILESTKEDRNALKFELKNMKTPDVYESGELVCRKVIES